MCATRLIVSSVPVHMTSPTFRLLQKFLIKSLVIPNQTVKGDEWPLPNDVPLYPTSSHVAPSRNLSHLQMVAKNSMN